MSLKKIASSAWTDITTLKKVTNGAWTDCEFANAFKNGAWEEVWSSAGIEPYGLYQFTANGSRIGCSIVVDGTDITFTLRCSYGYRWQRIIIPLDGNTTTELEIDYLFSGLDSTAFTRKLIVNASDNIIANWYTSLDNYETIATIFETSSDNSVAENGRKVTFSTTRKYLYLDFMGASGEYDDAVRNLDFKLFITKLKINGRLVKGNMRTA